MSVDLPSPIQPVTVPLEAEGNWPGTLQATSLILQLPSRPVHPGKSFVVDVYGYSPNDTVNAIQFSIDPHSSIFFNLSAVSFAAGWTHWDGKLKDFGLLKCFAREERHGIEITNTNFNSLPHVVVEYTGAECQVCVIIFQFA